MNLESINLALSCNQAHMDYAATTVASVARRTRRPVHARVYVREGEVPESFQAGNLTVEFLRSRQALHGRMPSHVSDCAYDRMEIVEYATDWDRCWVLDTDQLALGDLAELNDEAFGSAWMVARSTCTAGAAAAGWFGHGWPVGAPGADDRMPYFGALLNLAAMREGGFIGTFRHAVAAWAVSEQLATSIAVRGRFNEAALSSNRCLDGGHGEAGRPGDLEWEHADAHLVHWTGTAKPWRNPAVPGAQLWLRELTDWTELKYEVAFRERDRGKIPAFVVHLARIGVRNPRLPDALEDAGFGLELLRGCDPNYPAGLCAAVGSMLRWFGWDPTRANMARVLSHRWTWQAFLQQSEESYALVCEDELDWHCSEPELRKLCDSLGAGRWVLDCSGGQTEPASGDPPIQETNSGTGPCGRCYCLSREAARLLVEADLRATLTRKEVADSLGGLRMFTAAPGMATPASDIPAPARLLVAISSRVSDRDRRQAVRDTWFPRDSPSIDTRFFTGAGTIGMEEANVVSLPVPEDRGHQPLKTLELLRHALRHCDFDWLFKCDDDTYLAPDRLQAWTDGLDRNGQDEFILLQRTAGSGAAYLLSRTMVERLAADATLPTTGDEGEIIGNALKAHGVPMKDDWKLAWNHATTPRWDDAYMFTPGVSTRRMAEIHSLCQPPAISVEVAHPQWHDDVLLHHGGLFTRKTTRDEGRWILDSARCELTLAWSSHHPQTFVVDVDGRATPATISTAPLACYAPSKIIHLRPTGRTGNQFFIFAYGLHLQRKFGCRLHGHLHLLANVEGVPAEVVDGPPPERSGLIQDVDDDAVARCLAAPGIDGLELHGIFQSYGHFEGLRAELRELFGPVAKRDAIGVHVRRGDYLWSGHDLNLPAFYFSSGVRQIMRDHPGHYREILVFSDDPGWCARNLVAEFNRILPASIFEGGERETLRAMKSMRGMVITNSTFGWCGAWLADCPTVFPTTWRVPGGNFTPGLGCSDPQWQASNEYREGIEPLVSAVVDRSDPIDLLAHLSETGVKTDLVRYGPDHDGGYYVPAIVSYDTILTVGVGGDIGFETAYARAHPGTRFELFDHTVTGLPEPLPNAAFHRIGAGYGEGCRPMPDLLAGGLTAGKTVLLKIDCEGAEWHCGLEHLDFSRIHTLLLEIHGVLGFDDPARVAAVLSAVADGFTLLHASPNNHVASGTIQGHVLTNCIELTLVNRNLAANLPPRTQGAPPIIKNTPEMPPAWLEFHKRSERIPTIVTAFFNIGTFQKGDEGRRNAETYRRWLRNFAKIENPLVFFAETDADLELMRTIRSRNHHPTRLVKVDRAGLRAFRRLEKVRKSIRTAAYATDPPNTTVPEYSCVQHAKYELVGRAIDYGWIDTAYCCWMDCGRIFDSLSLEEGRHYQLQHRPDLTVGVHYTEAGPFVPKSMDAIQCDHNGAGSYSLAGAFFYGRTQTMRAWCATYLENALRYQAAGHVFIDQTTLYAMLAEGLAGIATSHRHRDPWFGLCADLLHPVHPRLGLPVAVAEIQSPCEVPRDRLKAEFEASRTRLERLRPTDRASYQNGTHLEALRDILLALRPADGEVLLEFGGGHFSTPLLLATGAQVISVEHGRSVPDSVNANLLRELRETYQDRPNWHLLEIPGIEAWPEAAYPPEILFCFVDGNGDCRKEVVEIMLEREIPVIAAHDSKTASVRDDRIHAPAEYSVHDFCVQEVWTRVWSRHHGLTRFMDESPRYHSVGSAPSVIDLREIPACLIGADPNQPRERQHRYWNRLEFKEKLFPHTIGVPAMPGGHAFGCSASHLAAVRLAIADHPNEPVLLMENDAVQTAWFQPILDPIPVDADIIWLGCSNGPYDGRPSPEFIPNPNSNYQRIYGVCLATHAVLLVTDSGKRAWRTCCERAVAGEMGASTDLVCSIIGVTLCRQYVLARQMFFQPDHNITLLPLLPEQPNQP